MSGGPGGRLLVHFDCRHYRGSRPCAPHKEHGYTCEQCPVYSPTRQRVLVVKLGAMGDVLRTTAVLEPIRRAWPAAKITWITSPASIDLLASAPEVDAVVPADHEALTLLAIESFDLVLGLDADPMSARFTTLARSSDKRGFVMGADGAVRPSDEHAWAWFLSGIDDSSKAMNKMTYQELVLDACRLPPPVGSVRLQLTAAERAAADAQMAELGVPIDADVVGLNVGSGSRWKTKRWPSSSWIAFMHEAVQRWPDRRLMLLGGPDEAAVVHQLVGKVPSPNIVACPVGLSVRQFAALIERCRVVVTGDTLCLHVAVALGRYVVALFGPTSADEIELYGLGEKLKPSEPCCCFYCEVCTEPTSCLATIAVTDVIDAVDRQWELSAAGSASGEPSPSHAAAD